MRNMFFKGIKMENHQDNSQNQAENKKPETPEEKKKRKLQEALSIVLKKQKEANNKGD